MLLSSRQLIFFQLTIMVFALMSPAGVSADDLDSNLRTNFKFGFENTKPKVSPSKPKKNYHSRVPITQGDFDFSQQIAFNNLGEYSLSQGLTDNLENVDSAHTYKSTSIFQKFGLNSLNISEIDTDSSDRGFIYRYISGVVKSVLLGTKAVLKVFSKYFETPAHADDRLISKEAQNKTRLDQLDKRLRVVEKGKSRF